MHLSFTLDKTVVQTKLVKMAERVADLAPALETIGDELLHLFGDTVFEQQGVAGEAWRQLAPSTQRMRLRHWGYYASPSSESSDRRILIWTGRLQHGFYKAVEARRLEIGNNVEYFKYHQAAGGRPPQRRMLALTSDVVAMVTKGLNNYVINSPR